MTPRIPLIDVDLLAAAMRSVAPGMRSFGGERCDCVETTGKGGMTCYGHDWRDQEAAAVAAAYTLLAALPVKEGEPE